MIPGFKYPFSKQLTLETSRRLESRPLPNFFAAETPISPTSNPNVLLWNEPLAQQLGLPQHPTPDLSALFGGKLSTLSTTYSTRYGGHQFGHWAGQLGDGRVINLGVLNNLEVQLKGAGPTPFSRRADGRAVFRSSFREYVASEAMERLGAPTTRALSLALTGDWVERDFFYDGHPKMELGAITTRVAPHFLRFGHLEILAAEGEQELFRNLLYHLLNCGDDQLESKVTHWFAELCEQTQKMVLEWTRVGFVHGVMNTDNMSLGGWTIDYGPFGFMDRFDPHYTPNTTDYRERRYRFAAQGAIAHWNLSALAAALVSQLPKLKNQLEQSLDRFEQTHTQRFLNVYRRKLGGWGAIDNAIEKFLNLAVKHQIDYLTFFAGLSLPIPRQDKEKFLLEQAESTSTELVDFVQDWLSFASVTPDIVQQLQNQNPFFVPRNWILQELIEGFEQDQNSSPLQNILRLLEKPYEWSTDKERTFVQTPKWAYQRAGCSALSCSS